jgi:hypothetical protein
VTVYSEIVLLVVSAEQPAEGISNDPANEADAMLALFRRVRELRESSTHDVRLLRRREKQNRL